MAERPPPVPPAGRSKKVPGETERLPKELEPGKRKTPRGGERDTHHTHDPRGKAGAR